jgi:phytoene synthase
MATRLLAAQQRPAVHALYGFARRADDILDDLDFTLTGAERGARLQQLAAALFDQMVSGAEGGDESLAAVVHTARRYGIAWQLFDDFLASMRMDLTVTDYPDRAALERYMYGSAEVIGLQLLPVLGTVCPREEAAPYAAALGKAFQLTNFLRDVDEDLERGRIYLPADELAAHHVDRDVLLWCHQNRRTDKRVRRALVAQHAETRRIYEYARTGISLLAPRSRPCVAAALTLYSEILDRIEELDFAVFSQRATVGTSRRIRVAANGLAKAWAVQLRALGT